MKKKIQKHIPKDMFQSSHLALYSFGPIKLDVMVEIILLSSEVSRIMTK